jgi:hypothetical protein
VVDALPLHRVAMMIRGEYNRKRRMIEDMLLDGVGTIYKTGIGTYMTPYRKI